MYYFTDEGNTVVYDRPQSTHGDVKASRNNSYRNDLIQQMQEK